jgi:hypothetical protein
MAGLKQLQSCRDGFRQLKILTVYWLYIQKTILYAKEKCNCIVNSFIHLLKFHKILTRSIQPVDTEIVKNEKQVHTYNTRNNDYHRYVHNLEL